MDTPRCQACGAEDYEPLCPSCEADQDDRLDKIAQAIAAGRLEGHVHGGAR